MPRRVYVQDLVAKTIGLCLIHDACKAASGAGDGNGQRLLDSVKVLVGGVNSTYLVPASKDVWRSPATLAQVQARLEALRAAWRDHADNRGWVFHWIEDKGRLKRDRLSTLLFGASLSGPFNAMANQATYLAATRTGDFAKLVPDSRCQKTADKRGALGGGDPLWEALSLVLGCGLADGGRHFERMHLTTTRGRDPNKKTDLNQVFDDQPSEGIFVTPAPETVLLRLACAFGFGRGGNHDSPTHSDFARQTAAGWQEEWAGQDGAGRKAIWDLFSGDQDSSTYLGGSVDGFLTAYWEFLTSSPDFKAIVAPSRQEPAAPTRQTEPSPGDAPEAPHRLTLKESNPAVGQPLSILIELQQERLVQFNVKAGNIEEDGWFSFRQVWFSVDLSAGPEVDTRGFVRQDTVPMEQGGTVTITRNGPQDYHLITHNPGGFPTSFMLPEPRDLFAVIDPSDGHAITAALFARMSDLRGTLEAPTEPNPQSLLDRVLAAHDWAEQQGITKEAWTEDTNALRKVREQTFVFRKRPE